MFSHADFIPRLNSRGPIEALLYCLVEFKL